MRSVHPLSRRSMLYQGASAVLATTLATFAVPSVAAGPDMRRSALTRAQALGRAIANLLQTRPADAAEQLRFLLQGAEAWVPVGHGMMFQADTLLILAFRPEFPSSTVGEPMTAITDAAMLADRLDAADPSERNRALASFSIPRDARLRILQREGAANWRLAIATFSSKQKRSFSGITNDKYGWIIENI